MLGLRNAWYITWNETWQLEKKTRDRRRRESWLEVPTMDWSSWLLRSVSRSSDNSKNSQNSNQQIPKPGGGEEEQLGVTQQLIDHVKSFTIDTFKNFPLQGKKACLVNATTSSSMLGFLLLMFSCCLCILVLEDEATPSSSTKTSPNVQRDLSEWQERHATLVLSKAKVCFSLLSFL